MTSLFNKAFALGRALWAQGADHSKQRFLHQIGPNATFRRSCRCGPEAIGVGSNTDVLRKWRWSGSRAATSDPPFGARRDEPVIVGDSGSNANRRPGTPSTTRPLDFS
jgi:hypothetical protein